MMPELEVAAPPTPPRRWRATALRAARIGALWIVGASAVAFWVLLFAAAYLGARPFGRLYWEPPAGFTAEDAERKAAK